MTLDDFVTKKKPHWYKLHALVDTYERDKNLPHQDLTEMIRLYRAACADYAFARLTFPYERIVSELHQLISRSHNTIYGRTKITRYHWSSYFLIDIPTTILRHRRLIFLSALVFVLGGLFAFAGSLANNDLPRHLLGDAYVSKTESNIRSDDPFAIYKSEQSPAMSGFLMTNNIKVTFLTFSFGLFAGIGTLYVLFHNGLIIGAFFYIFFKHGLLFSSFLTIMMHGTLELFSVFIAGGAGLCVGRALVFPGNFPRITALRNASREALTLIIGIVPMLIIAGIIEGFITRLSLPDEMKIIFIGANLIVLGWYLMRSKAMDKVN
ncbi:MAG TPA: stage II sporulation protein M [bacterium]|nr:stage II sporulation protein M [bacterium]